MVVAAILKCKSTKKEYKNKSQKKLMLDTNSMQCSCIFCVILLFIFLLKKLFYGNWHVILFALGSEEVCCTERTLKVICKRQLLITYILKILLCRGLDNPDFNHLLAPISRSVFQIF